jgi:hypothetical protein
MEESGKTQEDEKKHWVDGNGLQRQTNTYRALS